MAPIAEPIAGTESFMDPLSFRSSSNNLIVDYVLSTLLAFHENPPSHCKPSGAYLKDVSQVLKPCGVVTEIVINRLA